MIWYTTMVGMIFLKCFFFLIREQNWNLWVVIFFVTKKEDKKSSQLYGMTSQFKLIADGLIFCFCVSF